MRQAGGVPRSRLGVVLLVPDPWAHQVDGLRRACGDSSLGMIPAHITLIPPINVRHDDIAEVLEAVRATAASYRPLRIQLQPAATFSPVTPVAYLPVGGDIEELQSLHRDLLEGPLERPERYPYVPHVTLPDGAGDQRLEAIVTALGDYEASFEVTAVHVLRQEEDRTWHPLAGM